MMIIMPSGKRLLLGIFINREFLTLKLEVINRSQNERFDRSNLLQRL